MEQHSTEVRLPAYVTALWRAQLTGVTLVSIAALAPAYAQQAGSANQSMSKSSPAL